jgi:hypothetical protein
LETPDPGGPVQNPISQIQNLRLVRPLLDISRSEIEAYCKHYGLEPRFDRSNLDTTYFRNWLRHEVLPLLAQHNPMRRSAARRAYADDMPRCTPEEADAHGRRNPPDRLHPGGLVQRDRSRPGGVAALGMALQRASCGDMVHRCGVARDINWHIENAPLWSDGTTGGQHAAGGC